MSRRAILALSAALSAFVLILGGAAAGYGLRTSSAPAKAAESVPVDLVRAREAEYRRLLDEASAQLRAQRAAAAGDPSPEWPRALSASRSVEPEEEWEHASHASHEREHARR